MEDETVLETVINESLELRGHDLKHGNDANILKHGNDANILKHGNDSNDLKHGNDANDLKHGNDANDLMHGNDANDLMSDSLMNVSNHAHHATSSCADLSHQHHCDTDKKSTTRSADHAVPPVLARPIKRARTAYFVFQDEKRTEVQAAHPGESVGNIARAIGQLWSNLTPEEKEKYQLQAAREREQVSKDMEELRLAGLVPDAVFDASNPIGGGSGDGVFTLPVARIRKICRLDPEVRGISKEAVLLVTRATEYFCVKLGKETAHVAQMQNRRKLLPDDVADVCSMKEPFFFLREDIKDLLREQVVEKKGAATANAVASDGTAAAVGVTPLASYFGLVKTKTP